MNLVAQIQYRITRLTAMHCLYTGAVRNITVSLVGRRIVLACRRMHSRESI